jgi:hypothetical protein
VLLKHPGGVPAGAGGDGGGIGDLEAFRWHWAHTDAFAGSVSVCLYTLNERQLLGWGGVWQRKQEIFAPPPEKSPAWQIWQETKPELPGAFFADVPWPWGGPEGNTTQPVWVPWWHAAVKQEVFAIPPARSFP